MHGRPASMIPYAWPTGVPYVEVKRSITVGAIGALVESASRRLSSGVVASRLLMRSKCSGEA
jgi:hypothetical protein